MSKIILIVGLFLSFDALAEDKASILETFKKDMYEAGKLHQKISLELQGWIRSCVKAGPGLPTEEEYKSWNTKLFAKSTESVSSLDMAMTMQNRKVGSRLLKKVNISSGANNVRAEVLERKAKELDLPIQRAKANGIEMLKIIREMNARFISGLKAEDVEDRGRCGQYKKAADDALSIGEKSKAPLSKNNGVSRMLKLQKEMMDALGARQKCLTAYAEAMNSGGDEPNCD
jgi:hypothetical protein